MARKIVVTSGKGGVGKTTIVANIGYMLSMLGKRVCLVDTDFGLNNLDVIMGVENKIQYDIIDLIERRAKLRQVLLQVNGNPNLYILPSNSNYNTNVINAQNLKFVTERLSSVFDYVIIDCPAGIELGFHRAVASASEAIVVTTPTISSIRDASKVIKVLSQYELPITGLIVNRCRGDLMLNGEMMGIGEIVELLSLPPIGAVPEDDSISIFQSIGEQIENSNDSNKAFKTIAENINFNECELYDCTKKYKGFIGKIKRDIKRRV